VRAGAVVSLTLALALAGCKGRDQPAPAAAASVDEGSGAIPAVSARRPARRYFLARQGAHCEIFFSDPEKESPVRSTPCPLDLQVGERIRIAGRTCLREGGPPERVVPVVCPDPLTNLEKRERGEVP
jgi:hypothetical protein